MLYKNYIFVLIIAISFAVTPIHSQLIENEYIPAILKENPVDSHLLKLVTGLSETAHFSKKRVTKELSPIILMNFFFQAYEGIREALWSRWLGDLFNIH